MSGCHEAFDDATDGGIQGVHSQPVFGELALAGADLCAEFRERDLAEVEPRLQPLICGASSGGIESVSLAKLLEGIERVLGSKVVGYQHTADVEVKSGHGFLSLIGFPYKNRPAVISRPAQQGAPYRRKPPPRSLEILRSGYVLYSGGSYNSKRFCEAGSPFHLIIDLFKAKNNLLSGERPGQEVHQRAGVTFQ
jgi:hypothetical protein